MTKNILQVWIIIIFLIGMYGCSLHRIRYELGKPIDENKISQIVRGRTTSSEIMEWFGAPRGSWFGTHSTSKLGDDELSVYNFCVAEGQGIGIFVIFEWKLKGDCQELSIIFDKKTGKVKDYSYKKPTSDNNNRYWLLK